MYVPNALVMLRPKYQPLQIAICKGHLSAYIKNVSMFVCIYYVRYYSSVALSNHNSCQIDYTRKHVCVIRYNYYFPTPLDICLPMLLRNVFKYLHESRPLALCISHALCPVF